MCLRGCGENRKYMENAGQLIRWQILVRLFPPHVLSLNLNSQRWFPKMNLPGDLGLEDGIPQLLALGVLALISIYFFTRLFTDPEAAVDYDCQEPEQLRADWKAEVLEDPGIKVLSCTIGLTIGLTNLSFQAHRQFNATALQRVNSLVS